MPVVAKMVRYGVWGHFLRDLTGLSLRPRHLEHAWEDITGIPHLFLEMDRGLGLEPPRETGGVQQPLPFTLPFDLPKPQFPQFPELKL